MSARSAGVVVNATNAHEYQVNDWVTEASDLGLPVGEVPDQLATTLGNGQPFKLCGATAERWFYVQHLGCVTLAVYND